MEKIGVPLIEAFSIVERCNSKTIEGPVGAAYETKMRAVLGRNPGYKTIQALVAVHRGEKVSKNLPWEPAAVASMKFAPITSCDVERSFSMYKRVLRDDRKKFSVENIEKHMVVLCFK